MMGVVAGPLAVAGFVMPANCAMETIEVPTAHTAPHAEPGPAPPTSKRGAAATADSPSTAHLVNSSVLSPLINVRPLQLRSPQRVPSAWNGSSWLGCGDWPAMGAVVYLGAGWPQWKPLDIPGTHLPLSEAAG